MLEADPLAVLAAAGVVPVVSVEDAATAVTLSRLLVEHGLPVVEITFRTDAARDAIAAVAAAVPEITIVAGTVLTPAQAEEALTAGAHLLVAPGTNPNVVRRAAELGVPMLPGVCTPTDLEAALELGVTTVKFFPAEAIGGVPYLKALSAPYAGVRFNPTGGITLERLGDWLAVPSVIACGGSWLAPAGDLAAGRFDDIGARVDAAVQRVAEVRRASSGG